MSERKEILQLNGLSILLIMLVIASLLVVAFFERYHSYKIFQSEKAHSTVMTKLKNRLEHDIKLEITQLEGAKNWNSTLYATTHKAS